MLNPILFAAFSFLLLLILLTWVGYRVFYKPGKFLKQLGRPVITESRRVVEDASEPGGSTIVTFLHQLGNKMPSSDADVATMRATLVRAGYRSENAVPVFFGIRIVTTLAMLAICVALEPRLPPNPMLKMMLMISGCAAGWVMPRFFLEKRVAKRQEILRLSLPDALDLLVVSVEAGLGLDQAIQHVGRELQVGHPQLSEEMLLVMLEMRAGKRRSDALRLYADCAPAGSRRARRQSGREAGVPYFLFHTAVHVDCGGGPGHPTDFQISVPDDEPFGWYLEINKKEKRRWIRSFKRQSGWEPAGHC